MDLTPKRDYVILTTRMRGRSVWRRTLESRFLEDSLDEAREQAANVVELAKDGGRVDDTAEVFELCHPGAVEAAYRAGREDAAREVAAAGEGWDDARDAYWHMVNKAEEIRGADQPRKLAGSAGDNPEEQRPALDQERSDDLRCHTWVSRKTSPEPFWCDKVAGHSGPHGRVEEQRP